MHGRVLWKKFPTGGVDDISSEAPVGDERPFFFQDNYIIVNFCNVFLDCHCLVKVFIFAVQILKYNRFYCT